MSEREKVLRVTWTKSAIGYAGNQKRTIAALGLRRLHQSVEHADSPALRGMVSTVAHLVRAEEIVRAAGGNADEGDKA